MKRGVCTSRCAAVAGVCSCGIAAGQVYTDPSAFHAAAGTPAHLVTADDLPHNTTLTTQYPGIDFGGTVRTWDAISLGGGGTAVSPRNVLFNFGAAPMRWTFLQPPRSIGVYNPSNFDRIRLRLLRADGSMITSIDMDTGTVTFAGYIASEDIVTVEAAGIAGFSNFTIFLDNLEWGSTCPADFNHDGGIDGTDVEAFFAAWESGDESSDVNQDGGIDGADVAAFFDAWESGGC